MAFFTILTSVNTLMLYSIIWFERENNNRILINLMISSLSWLAIFYSTFVYSWSVLRFLIGPFKCQIMCALDSFLRNFFILQVLLIHTSIVLIRYFCIMWSKNPTALQDDFWQLFINLWTILLTSISQFIYYVLPGKEPINYYICMGEYPYRMEGIGVKINYSQVFIFLICLVTHFYVEISIRTLRKNIYKEKLGNTPVLYSYVSNGMSLLFIFLFFYALKILNSMNSKEMDTYPNYLYFYSILFYTPVLVIFIVTLSLFYKKQLLRKKVKTELETFLG